MGQGSQPEEELYHVQRRVQTYVAWPGNYKGKHVEVQARPQHLWRSNSQRLTSKSHCCTCFIWWLFTVKYVKGSYWWEHFD